MRALSVTSELFPIVKTGGLADVTGALPSALAREGIDVTTLIPGYRTVMSALGAGARAQTVLELDLFGGPVRVLASRASELDLYVIDAPHLYDREGGPYGSADGRDWPDNALRFAALAQIGARIGTGALGWTPDIVHVHDWQAGLLPAYFAFANVRTPATIMTVHNLAFAGRFDPSILATIGLPPQALQIEGVEYHGDISYLKAGLQYADFITTVSPTYALEITTPQDGMGFDGVLRARGTRFTGILNGIDTAIWDPARDAMIAQPYDARTLNARANNTVALRHRFALDDDPSALVVGVVARLSWQKGLDMLLDILPATLERGTQCVVLGSGDRDVESAFTAAVAQYPGRIGVYIGYDERAAHLVQAGAGVIAIPSRFEPCGLTQLCALRYGAIPLVARVGGLADTVIDANEMALAAGVATGLQFSPPAAQTLDAALRRAEVLFTQPEVWQRMQRNAMATDVSWNRSGGLYARLYREAIRLRT